MEATTRTTPVRKKQNFATTFLWIFFAMIVLYLIVIYSTPSEYYGVEDVQYENLDYYLHNNNTAAFFYHDDCPHCNEMMPMYETISNDFPNVRFITISADKSDIPYEENIGAFPLIRIYNEKNIEGDIVGKMSEEELKEQLKSLVSGKSETMFDRLLKYFKNLKTERESGQDFKEKENKTKTDDDASETKTDDASETKTEDASETKTDDALETKTEDASESKTEDASETKTDDATTQPTTDATQPTTDATQPTTDATTQPTTDATTQPTTDATIDGNPAQLPPTRLMLNRSSYY